jgi:hypothetical protein
MRIVQFTDTHLLPKTGEALHGVDTYQDYDGKGRLSSVRRVR